MGEEEADPMLELAMEYASALGTIVFNKLCCLCDLTEAQIGQNQFTMDIAVDRLDGEVDHASERISVVIPQFLRLPEQPMVSFVSGSLVLSLEPTL